MRVIAETCYAESDGLSVAYQVWGEGPRNLVLAPGMISHLEASLDRPGYLRWIEGLAAIGRLAVFDKRGNGMSDRIQGAPTLDERMMDIEAVMDAAEMRTATLIGVSEGASLACAYAGLRPERVDRLVLCGGYARGRLARGLISEEGLRANKELFRANWGKADGVHPFTPFGPGPENPEGRAAFVRFERMSATPTTVAALYELSARIDISDLVPSLRKPALVLHRETEEPNGADAAADFVRLLPDVKYQVLPGSEHLPWEGDVESYVSAIAEFVTGAAQTPAPATRALATVLFSDLVESTAMQAKLGDDAWRRLMNRHDEVCSSLIPRFGGRLVKFTGDGLLATFDTPTGALDCATELRRALAAFDLKVRFGAHTGEIEIRGDDVSGLGVTVAARIMDKAEDGGILASDLTRQLMLGSRYAFETAGEHELKGIPDRWRLYEVAAE